MSELDIDELDRRIAKFAAKATDHERAGEPRSKLL